MAVPHAALPDLGQQLYFNQKGVDGFVRFCWQSNGPIQPSPSIGMPDLLSWRRFAMASTST